MFKKVLLALIVSVLFISVSVHVWASVPLGDPLGLPVGPSPECFDTSVSFLPTWYGHNIFLGIRIESVLPGTTGVTITERSGGAVLYSGSISPGQYIPLETPNIIWTACKSTPGNHGNGIIVQAMYTDTPQSMTPSKTKGGSNAFSCENLEGSWSHETENIGCSSSWTLTRTSENNYRAVESGCGNATGTALLTGRNLKIKWYINDSCYGYYEWNLNDDCSGCTSGKMVWESNGPVCRGERITTSCSR